MISLDVFTHQRFVSRLLFLMALSGSVVALDSDADWDGDGIPNEVETRIGTEPYLSDTDGDGVSDKVEVGDFESPTDTDQDGRIDALDLDDDGDQVPTVHEKKSDSDGDGMADYLDTDSDGDGRHDGDEEGVTGRDSDNDYVDDYFDADVDGRPDENGDGIIDTIEYRDSDKDGIPDVLDTDQIVVSLSDSDDDQPAMQKSDNKIMPEQQSESDKPDMAEKESGAKDMADKSDPVVLESLSLPEMQKTQRQVRYMDKSEAEEYRVNGFFYCEESLKIVPGITRFMVSPADRTKIIKNASTGEYEWTASESGIYALQFQIPQGMQIVTSKARGRRIVKETDQNPMRLGGGADAGKSGYLESAAGSWYTSFEFKRGAPPVLNNNIPLKGGICQSVSGK